MPKQVLRWTTYRGGTFPQRTIPPGLYFGGTYRYELLLTPYFQLTLIEQFLTIGANAFALEVTSFPAET